MKKMIKTYSKKTLLISLFVLASCSFDSAETKMVKNGTLNACPEHTIEQLVNGFFGSPKWESDVSKDGIKFVNITGDLTYMDKPVKGTLQLLIDKDGKSFSYNAFELNGIPQNNLIAMSLVQKLCGQ